jgi:plastocyanin
MEQKYSVGVLVLAVIVLGAYYFWSENKNVTSPVAETVSEETDNEAGAPAHNAPSANPGGIPDPVPEGPVRVFENGVYVTVIVLTDLGFSPHEVTVTSGEEVRFVNKTQGAMRIGTNSSLSSQFYSGVAQPNVVGTGGSYQVGVIRDGIWAYENLTNPRALGATGIIYVK